jgi:F-type H+-transporting ATPase subunit b
VDILAIARASAGDAVRLYTEAAGGEEPGFQLNLFWIVAQAGSFLLFLVILYLVAFRRIGSVLEDRRGRIEQGLRDADAARRERERAASERQEVLADARREANEILSRAQKLADETRDRETQQTKAELERVREQAVADIQAERERALADVRAEVADLALRAAGRVVGETMTGQRERRLVEEFLGEVGTVAGDGRPTGPT